MIFELIAAELTENEKETQNHYLSISPSIFMIFQGLCQFNSHSFSTGFDSDEKYGVKKSEKKNLSIDNIDLNGMSRQENRVEFVSFFSLFHYCEFFFSIR